MSDNLIACDVGGRIMKAVEIGHRVEVGDALLVVRTDGPEITLDAPVSGRVKSMFFTQDDTLPEAAVVAIIES